jgi:predicted MFS family arabinose efflux permease
LLTLARTVAYVGVNVVTTAHRALVHDCFEGERYPRKGTAPGVAALTGGLSGSPSVASSPGGLVGAVRRAAVGMLVLSWPTLRWLPVTAPGDAQQRASPPLRFYATALIRPGVRSLLAAEILWVMGYAALPVFFLLYAKAVLGLEPGLASLWLAAFVGAGPP